MNEWISVYEKMPEPHTVVIAKTGDGYLYEKAVFDGCDWWDSESNYFLHDDFMGSYVTEWRPITTGAPE